MIPLQTAVETFELKRGTTPLLVSVPHTGTELPDWLAARMVSRAGSVEDTDWHLAQLYRFVLDQGAGLITPRYSRFVIDLNRPPDNRPMYAGTNNTELCPTRFFTGDPIYRDGQAPDDAEIRSRLDQYWRPYHQALRDELDRLKSVYGHAVLFDGHSIKSQLPWLFEGRLPDLNLGTASGNSCSSELRSQLVDVLNAQKTFSFAVDGRFTGGYITRSYGRPGNGIHAVQLEKCWSCYMPESAPYQLDPARTRVLQPVLAELVAVMRDWRPQD